MREPPRCPWWSPSIKIDRPNSNPEKVKKDLADYGLVPETWGGNTLYGEVSAKQRTGIKELLELILLQAEVLELRPIRINRPGESLSNPTGQRKRSRGHASRSEGTLKTGDVFVAGSRYGRVRAMLNDKAQKIEEARPSPRWKSWVLRRFRMRERWFIVVSEERTAKQISLYRQEKLRAKELTKLSKVSLEELYDRIKKEK